MGAWSTWLLFAAQWYVDGDAENCSTKGEPFCTLQEAFDNAELAAGDEILVRDAATPYDGAVVIDVDGTEDSPVVLRPDDGHTPIFGGTIQIADCSYWTVRGLTFDAGGGEPGHTAIVADTGGDPMEGIVIENNAIYGWGGAVGEEEVGGGIITVASYTADDVPLVHDPIVRNNRIVGGRGKAIHLSHVDGALVEGNEASELECQLQYVSPRTLENLVGMIGVSINDTNDVVVRHNRVHDFDATACELDYADMRAAGILLESSLRGNVHHNLVMRLGGQNEAGMGIDVINGSDDCSVHHNVVVDADHCGVCNGALAYTGGARARFVANTVIGGRGSGIELWGGEDSAFIANVIAGAGGAQVRLMRREFLGFDGGVETWSFVNNLYFGEDGGDNIGRLEYGSAVDLATWQGDCGCDADSIAEDPMLAPGGTENFTAATPSPVVDGAMPIEERMDFNGRAADLGALEAPLVLGAAIEASAPDRIRLALQSETSPLRHDPGCAGFVVTRDGVSIATAGCELDGDAILIGLSEPAYVGDAIAIAYAGTSVSNSDAIGGVVHALLQPFDLDVDNGSRELPPAESGDVATDSTSGESTSGTDAITADASTGGTDDGGGNYPSAEGCSCRTGRGGATWPWLFIAIGVARSCTARSRRRAARRP
jgi:hypothetical protein